MSARELIKQVTELPEQERVLFEQLFNSLRTGAAATGSPSGAIWPDFSERLQRIYGDKIAPDSQPIIDEGRGDR
jgi:hypothetical protein